MTRNKRKQTGSDRVTRGPLPNGRLEDVQNDTDAMTRRGVLRSGVGIVGLSLGVGAVAACGDDGDEELRNRELAESRGLVREWRDGDDRFPTIDTRSSHDLEVSLSGAEFTAAGTGGTACHSMHIARGGAERPDLGWYHDLVDMTRFDGEDSSAGVPVLESHHSYLREGGEVVFLVAENDRGMLASPDATDAFVDLIPERIKEQAVGFDG